MTGSNPVKHVLIALSLSALLFLIAGDQWSKNIKTIKPVQPVAKAS